MSAVPSTIEFSANIYSLKAVLKNDENSKGSIDHIYAHTYLLYQARAPI